MAIQQTTSNPESGRWIFTKVITLKNGKKLFAKSYNLEAFHIFVKGPKPES